MRTMRYLTTASIICALLVVLTPFVTSAQSVDAENSRVTIDKAELKADGIDNALVTVTARDTNMLPLVGWTTKLYSSRGVADEIREESTITDILGKAYFRVFSLKDGTATFTAQVGATMLDRTVTSTYSGGLSIFLQPGELIKIPDDNDSKTLSDTAVYYYAVDGKRYVFPNEKTYFTWYADFSKVKIIPIDQMSLIPIGGNVTYRPGTRMLKFQTDTKTYIVTRGGVLRWAMTEDVARGWFGTEWNTFVDDVSEAFYVNYTFGEPVASHLDLALDIIKDATRTIDQDRGL
ncbi:Ig-like domain-containing protein [Patescibacteria group bacterium]|nr:Ig-like domain-containing protein [Patescibacteria group bacterium]MBU2613529.1 Ig-like domain-containing protein [Patescibacteria group bacterium]